MLRKLREIIDFLRGHQRGSTPPPPGWVRVAPLMPHEPPPGPPCPCDYCRHCRGELETYSGVSQCGPPWHVRIPDPSRSSADRQERHESASDAGAAIAVPPLTADQVRKIVREEIDRARVPPWKSGRMGPG